MINNYDPNYCFGEHTIKVTIQEWQYRGNLKVKVNGNCKGMSVIEGISESIYDQANTLESDCEFVVLEEDGEEPWFSAILKDSDGNQLETTDLFDRLENLIVAIEIIDFTRR